MERGKWHPPLFLQWSRVLTKGLKKNCETSLRLKKRKSGRLSAEQERRNHRKKMQMFQ